MSESAKSDPAKAVERGAEKAFDFVFGDHLEDLRKSVLRAIILPFAVFLAVWPFWRIFHEDLKYQILGPKAGDLARIGMLDTFSVSIGLSLRISLLASIPWVLINIWWFVKPGLYPHERRFGRVLIPSSVLLFSCGIAFGYFVALPTAAAWLLDFGKEAIDTQLLAIDDFYKFVFSVMTVLGLVFMLPLVVAPAVRFDILKPAWVKKNRRLVIFGSAVAGAVFTPTGDPLNMALVAIPIYLLVEGGVIVGRFWRKLALRKMRNMPEGIAEGWREGLSSGGEDAPESTNEDNEYRKQMREEGLLGGRAADSFAATISNAARGISKNFEEGVREYDAERLRKPRAIPVESRDAPASDSEVESRADEAVPANVIEDARGLPGEIAPRRNHSLRGIASTVAGSTSSATVDTSRSGVPTLPRELRRRIDYYIKNRLEELLAEVLKNRDSGEHAGETPEDQPDNDSQEVPDRSDE